jgi:hypothetical protein
MLHSLGGNSIDAETMVAPGPPQYMRALELANQVRVARATLKREVAIGEVDVGDVILDCPWEALTMTVSELLISQRRWGSARSHKVLAALEIRDEKSLGSMTDRQCRALATLLRPSATTGGSPLV